MKSICLPSYAKINLGLSILGKRADGYHEIETILQQIAIKDEIVLEQSNNPEINLTCNDSGIPTNDSNLCIKAAQKFKQFTGITQGLKIKLHKTIPVGAGLGGGSSNAAVVLLGLNKLWNTELNPDQLEKMASDLGSDVPFFIKGGTAFAYGRGELLLAICQNSNQLKILVIFPGIHISTKWAYDNLNLSLTNMKKNINLSSFEKQVIDDLGFFHSLKNDFEEIVFSKYSILGKIKHHLYKNNAIYAGLSGSGSAVYGVFFENSDVLQAQKKVVSEFKTFITQFENWGYEQVNKNFKLK